MKHISHIAAVGIAAVALTSCGEDDPIVMTWKFSDYDQEAVSAVYTPEFVNQVSVVATPEHEGGITLECTNYGKVIINDVDAQGVYTNREAGFSVTKAGSNSLRIEFEPIDAPEGGVYGTITVDGRQGKDLYYTVISVSRLPK
ncbi:MAG: hypothetical protein ACI31C_06500 [Muribaculaceae bacterium]